MIQVSLQGGLGNQMFQYAFARALAHKGYEVALQAGFSYVSLQAISANRAAQKSLIGGGA